MLLCKALRSEGEVRVASLVQAEEEAKSALQIYKMYWGDYSVRLANAYCTLGQIHHKMEKLVCAIVQHYL